MAGCVKTNFGNYYPPLSHRFYHVRPSAMAKIALKSTVSPHFYNFSYTIIWFSHNLMDISNSNCYSGKVVGYH